MLNQLRPWLPGQRLGGRPHGLWYAICTAAGLVRQAPSGAQIVEAGYPTTTVEIVPGMLRGASTEAIGRGATLALRCTMCHGARGLSQANTPNLTGQFPAAVYKELVDFKTGARESAVMGPLVAYLGDQDMRELAVYYAYLPRVSGRTPTTDLPPRIVAGGAPMRGIAPSGACHATSPANPARRGSRDSPSPTCVPKSKPSPPAPGATTSASRCAMSRAA